MAEETPITEADLHAYADGLKQLHLDLVQHTGVFRAKVHFEPALFRDGVHGLSRRRYARR